ncbi:hypothetical protein SUGI_0574080 [Cryptomeria japonica]|nr:hypothetical protein SUGI_0574080 [Cryptomeria japonica]
MSCIGTATNNEAELKALDKGLELSLERGVTKILIEGDSRVVINGVMKYHFNNWRLDQWLPAIWDKVSIDTAAFFGVECLCSKQEGLAEAPEEQINRLFNKANDKEKETVVQILGTDFWRNGHVHDGVLLEAFLTRFIKPVPEFGVMVGYFDLNAEGVKTKMKAAWSLYKTRVGKAYSLEKFEAFMRENSEIMTDEMVARLVELGNGMAYLYY